ncbi:MAG: hypothetical protein EOS05_14230 [Mesorhizobium sp.]|nr:hypothetical protein EOC06_17090 [Mesorhizobium sp. M7A.F.Ca.MR.362.00.0.0]RWN93506.1 MAG: hypothetical protein EOS05_14230 [Mesorhizobium sp.]
MQTYLVEQMEGDDVVAASNVNASSPFTAATISTGRQVTLRTWENNWVRVTDELGGEVFAYCFISGTGEADRSAQPDTSVR